MTRETDIARTLEALELAHRLAHARNKGDRYTARCSHGDHALIEGVIDTLRLLADTPSVEPLDGARLDRIIAAYEKTSLEHDVFYEDFVEVVVAVRYERWIEARDARARLLPTQASDSPEKPT